MAKKVGKKTKESVEIKDVTLKELSRFLNGPIRIRTSRYGLLRFQMISMGDLSFFHHLIKQKLSSREFIVQTIDNELCAPKLELEIIRCWRDKFLKRVAITWIRDNPEIKNNLPERPHEFEDIAQIIINYINKFIEEIRNQQTSMARMLNLNSIESLSPALENIQRTSVALAASKALENVQRTSAVWATSPVLENVQRMSAALAASPVLENVQRMSAALDEAI